MPVTPLHFGLMAPINHFAPKRVSLVSFVIVNLLIDLEAIKAVLMGDDLLPSHDRPSHNLGGAAVIFALVAVVRLRSGPWKWGALLGCLSHLILDGMVHPEMQPFAPYVAGNPIYLGRSSHFPGRCCP